MGKDWNSKDDKNNYGAAHDTPFKARPFPDVKYEAFESLLQLLGVDYTLVINGENTFYRKRQRLKLTERFLKSIILEQLH